MTEHEVEFVRQSLMRFNDFLDQASMTSSVVSEMAVVD